MYSVVLIFTSFLTIFIYNILFGHISIKQNRSLLGNELGLCRKRYSKRSIDDVIRTVEKTIPLDSNELLSVLAWPRNADNPIRSSQIPTEKMDILSHLRDINNLEEVYLNSIFSSVWNQYSRVSCRKGKCLRNFINTNHDLVFYDCRDSRVFSFCQKHYLVSYDNERSEWKPYSPVNSINKPSHPNITLITQLSLEKNQSLPLILKRWSMDMIIILFVSMKELNKVEGIINKYYRANVKWLVYIHLKEEYCDCDDNYIIDIRDNVVFKECHHKPIFPINLLRLVSISTIQTSHYIMVDSDLIVSKSLANNFKKLPASLLNNEKNLFLIPSFMFNMSIVENCRVYHNCSLLWKYIPKSKRDLANGYREGKLSLIPNQYHQIINTSEWLQSSTKLYLVKCLNYSRLEPYFIRRRTDSMINYSPYYINYGMNKIEYIDRLRQDGYQFYIMMNDFGFDLPHERSNFSITYRQRVKVKGRRFKDPIYKMGYYYKDVLNYSIEGVVQECNSSHAVKGEYLYL